MWTIINICATLDPQFLVDQQDCQQNCCNSNLSYQAAAIAGLFALMVLICSRLALLITCAASRMLSPELAAMLSIDPCIQQRLDRRDQAAALTL